MGQLIGLSMMMVGLLFVGQQWRAGQSKRCVDPSARRGVGDPKARPQLGAEYSSAARFRIASRKTTYHIGEMISVDLAMLNTERAPTFFHKPLVPGITVTAQDEKGRMVNINSYATILEGVVPQSYVLLQRGEILLGSFQLLAGCNLGELSAFETARRKLNEEQRQNPSNYQEGIFSRNLFVNWGDACLAFQQLGTFTITVEQTNDHVIVSPCEPNVKTAVGTIRSTQLTVTIVE